MWLSETTVSKESFGEFFASIIPDIPSNGYLKVVCDETLSFNLMSVPTGVFISIVTKPDSETVKNYCKEVLEKHASQKTAGEFAEEGATVRAFLLLGSDQEVAVQCLEAIQRLSQSTAPNFKVYGEYSSVKFRVHNELE